MRIPLACLAIVLLGACRQAPAPAGPERPAEAPSPTPDTVAANFRCGDLLVGTVFDNAAGNVTLGINGSRTVLPQAVSASGARYADQAGNEFWNRGDEATLTLDGTSHACITAGRVPPWAEARHRGDGWRGIGTESCWARDVDGGDVPAKRLELDMGGRQLLVAGDAPHADGEGWPGTADDG